MSTGPVWAADPIGDRNLSIARSVPIHEAQWLAAPFGAAAIVTGLALKSGGRNASVFTRTT